MIFGMTTSTYTLVHVVLSLVGIGSGLLVVFGLLSPKHLKGWTALFLGSTVATTVTGFGFPFEHLLPSHIVGMVSLVVLAFAIPARYTFHLAGTWRWIYMVGSVIALYLNVFVGIVQVFLKVPTLRTMAPTQSEPPFVFTQLFVMACFVLLAITAVGRYRGEQIQSARSVAFPTRQSPGL